VTPTFAGRIESPTAVGPDTTLVSISGWVFCREVSIEALQLQIDDAVPVTLPYGIPRDDVAAVHGDAASLKSGFRIQVPVQIGTSSEITLTLIALLDDGRREVCLARSYRVYGPNSSRALRRADSLVRGAAIKLRLAIKNRQVPLSPARWVALVAQHWREVFDRPATRQPLPFDAKRLDDSYRRSALVNRRIRARNASAPLKPLSFVALIEGGEKVSALMNAVAALPGDSWRLWLVCFGDLASAQSLVREQASDGRVSVMPLASLIRPDGSWLPPGGDEYVVLLDSQTVPASGIFQHLEPLIRTASFDWIYTDDDRQLPGGKASDPYLKGGVSPELALVDDYMTRLATVRRRTIEEVGGLRMDAGAAQIYDLLLRFLQRACAIHHLPVIGCHRHDRVPAALGTDHRRVVERIVLATCKASTRVVQRVSPRGPELQELTWPADILESLPVTIVIPTRDRVDLLSRCIESIRRTVPSGVGVLVVDDHSCEPATADYLRDLEADPSGAYRIVHMTGVGEGFNYSRLMNTASREVATPLMLHLNNDIEAIAPGWLQQMAGWLAQDDIGVVGAKLVDRHGAIDHAGVVVAPRQGAPEHLFNRLAADDPGYQWLPHRLRNVSAVTGACLLTRTADFLRLGGFDEGRLRVQFNDVDFCLRVVASGHRIVYEPSAVLCHDVSASRGLLHDYRETAFFCGKYADYRDPFISQYFDVRTLAGPTPLIRSSSRGI
jgi:GT2 family glycosyltransferase